MEAALGMNQAILPKYRKSNHHMEIDPATPRAHLRKWRGQNTEALSAPRREKMCMGRQAVSVMSSVPGTLEGQTRKDPGRWALCNSHYRQGGQAHCVCSICSTYVCSCLPLTDRDCAFWQLLAPKSSVGCVQDCERMGHPGTPQLGRWCSSSLPCQFSPQMLTKPQGSQVH